MRSYGPIVGRALLVALALWALAMIVPDLYRVYQPLGSFGFYASNDGDQSKEVCPLSRSCWCYCWG